MIPVLIFNAIVGGLALYMGIRGIIDPEYFYYPATAPTMLGCAILMTISGILVIKVLKK